jgi:hypothetical protein
MASKPIFASSSAACFLEAATFGAREIRHDCVDASALATERFSNVLQLSPGGRDEQVEMASRKTREFQPDP